MDALHKKIKISIADILRPTTCLTLDQLLSYSEDRLSKQERFNVEAHLIDCELCSDALEGLMLSSDKKNIWQHIKTLNKKIHEMVASQSIVKHHWRVYYSIAAVIMLAFVSVLYLLDRKTSYESLYAENFKPYPNTVPIVRGEEPVGILESAMAEYENENYKESLIILQNLLKSESNNDTASFYAGIASLCLNDPQTAIVYLQKVINDKNSNLIEHATWYLGLAYLKEKNIEAAKTCFTKLSSKEGNFMRKSIELLNRL